MIASLCQLAFNFNQSHGSLTLFPHCACPQFALLCHLSRRFPSMQLRPNVFLGCFGDLIVIEQAVEALANLPKHIVQMAEVAHLVQNTVNTVLENSRVELGEMDKRIRFVLLGHVSDDTSYYFSDISKGEDTWMYLSKRELGRVVCAGSDAVRTFLKNNHLDENMSEEEAVDYGFKCMKYAVEHDWFAGGRIQVVAMKADGSSIVYTWEQNDPSHCGNEYLHQEACINHGHQERVSPEGNQAST